MIKLVNIYPRGGSVLTVNPPIRTSVKKVTKSVEEIRKCIIARAVVEEILPNGNIIRLNFSNYNTVNYEEPKKEEAVTPTTAPEEEKAPAAEEEKKEEKPVTEYQSLRGRDRRRNRNLAPVQPAAEEVKEDASVEEAKAEESKVAEPVVEDTVKTVDLEEM